MYFFLSVRTMSSLEILQGFCFLFSSPWKHVCAKYCTIYKQWWPLRMSQHHYWAQLSHLIEQSNPMSSRIVVSFLQVDISILGIVYVTVCPPNMKFGIFFITWEVSFPIHSNLASLPQTGLTLLGFSKYVFPSEGCILSSTPFAIRTACVCP